MEKKHSILLVEDANLVMHQITRILEDQNYIVYQAKNGAEGLEIAGEKIPDLIITDIMMPVMDGFELIKKLKADDRLKEIPVIILSCLDNDEDIVKGFSLGAFQFMHKPASSEVLIESIHSFLEYSSLLQEKKKHIERLNKKNEVSRILNWTAVYANNANNFKEALSDITGFICMTLKIDVCHVYLVENGKAVFQEKLALYSDESLAAQEMKKEYSDSSEKLHESPLIKEVLKTKNIHIVDSAEGKEASPEKNKDIHYQVAFPVIFNNSIVAVVEFMSSQKIDSCFGEKDICLENIGLQLGQVMERESYSREILKKNQELSELRENLVSMVIHDLKNPLSVITGTLEIWNSMDIFKQDEILAMQMDICQKSSVMLTDMVHEQLRLKKLEDGNYIPEFTEVDLVAIVEYIYFSNKEQFDESLEFKFNAQQNLPQLTLDEHLIRRTIQNMFTNALKFTTEGFLEITVNYDEKNEKVTIIIKDTGAGIKQEDIPHLFDRYYQAEQKRKGTSSYGLGLSFCDFAVKAMKGQIAVSSEIDKGSQFTLTIPTKKGKELCKPFIKM
ncbi:MAG: response regulator [Nitrospinae bacterium]|nr:response regulator [Nitrospinota bacterium]